MLEKKVKFILLAVAMWGFPGGASGKEPTCQCKRLKRCRFNPWVRKIPWRRKWQPTPIFPWAEDSGRLQSIGSQSQTLRSDLACTHTKIAISWTHLTPATFHFSPVPYLHKTICHSHEKSLFPKCPSPLTT